MLKTDKTVLIQFKIKTDTNIFRSISFVQRVNTKDHRKLFNIFNDFLERKSSNYHQIVINEIIFTYFILDTNIKTKFKNITVKPNKMIEFVSKISNFNLPNNMLIKS